MIKPVSIKEDNVCLEMSFDDILRLKTACSQASGVFYASGYANVSVIYDGLRENLQDICRMITVIHS